MLFYRRTLLHNTPTCTCTITGSPYQFGDAMAVTSTYPDVDGLSITVYGFRTDATKDSILEDETLFSIPASLDLCKLEAVVEVPVPDSGDLSFAIDLWVEKDDADETALNNYIQSSRVGSSIFFNTTNQGDDDAALDADGGQVMEMSTRLVCASTEAYVSDSDVTVTKDNDYQKWTFSVASSAVSSCGSVYFDPKVNPIDGPSAYASMLGDNGGLKWWMYGLIALGVVLLAVGLWFLVKKKGQVSAKTSSAASASEQRGDVEMNKPSSGN